MFFIENDHHQEYTQDKEEDGYADGAVAAVFFGSSSSYNTNAGDIQVAKKSRTLCYLDPASPPVSQSPLTALQRKPSLTTLCRVLYYAYVRDALSDIDWVSVVAATSLTLRDSREGGEMLK